ncbi:NADPH-dependent FMN reductase [Leisingera methylohalidivorans]|uniref:NADPH-dependent FMN reductase n=1 Tax=Leisingera methylohalidivorans DSM 14336 TaxID=999552 RepID=V9VXY6_9RHOB|nr:NAD(P)H-dependent oxidoreductase [Leisingera methylohalidivorans]AHD02235.1 NADPH-dependent FMN reductase [Leisingera methylohalidivorans DSM 14336]
MLTLQIILGSIRQGRGGVSVARWFEEAARQDGRFNVEFVDLLELNLPMMDEPNHPRLAQYTHEHTRRFSELISRGDAYVFVSSEYNFGIPGALKNALDYLALEWAGKPMSVFSYGGISGAIRAAEDLRRTAVALNMVPLNHNIVAPLYTQQCDDEGRFSPNPVQADAAQDVLNALSEWGEMLRNRRQARH